MMRGFGRYRGPRSAAIAAAALLCVFLVSGLFGCSYIPTPAVPQPAATANPATATPVPATLAPATREATIPPAAPSPQATPAAEFESILSSLIVQPVPEELAEYNRKDWRHWVDADKDCQDARQEVLVAESTQTVVFTEEDQCRVESGNWVAPFTGVVETDPGKLDVDHLVPLANAHRSGAHSWSKDRKKEYANDLINPAHLVAVTARANRSKGAKGPEDWKPPDAGYWCQYATDWAGIKTEWVLTVTLAERDALAEMLDTCNVAAP